MSKLKELTWENHKNAERQRFARMLMSGKMEPYLYAKFLYNQYHCYKALESCIELPKDLEHIKRASLILDDCWEIIIKCRLLGKRLRVLNTTQEYVEYVKQLDQRGLLAHMYVRHFGDMYGGSMIAKKIPGEGRMYKFKNKQDLISKMRLKLDDEMAPEANRCFKFATAMFEELLPNDI